MSDEIQPHEEPEDFLLDEGMEGLEVSASAWFSTFGLPPPPILGQFEQEVPGTADKFWEYIGQEQSNRHEFNIHNADLFSNHAHTVTWSQTLLGALIVLGAVGLPVLVFLVSNAGFGSAILGAELLTTCYITYQRSRKSSPPSTEG